MTKINPLDEVMTFAEASEKWGLGESTLRSTIRTDRLVEGVDYKKSGKVWLITKEAMERVYGNLNKNII
ncbi:helix-turn-helix domain-containing protein [Clostridium cagae]|uniref:helix-turn-helix domain-containing protein n=1 Tax=Clostridium cagae TaxID=2080751 RepID=UPI000CF5E43B|nr:helix-turn-helix domain-containing protein [Clostridium cagae]NFN14579.1 helix-turn-helix domain-containing protein [Clostridium botulinum]